MVRTSFWELSYFVMIHWLYMAIRTVRIYYEKFENITFADLEQSEESLSLMTMVN